ncbi:hypothetical protein FRC11_010963 [Ceratobasidium sp. 423]|nr:hypothetical protein FRC11_010963 [Ceratobasidium sp. 423]
MSTTIAPPRPFKINIPDEEIERLKTVLKAQRLPQEVILPGADFGMGTELSWIQKAKQELIDFDWRAAEKVLNSFDQYLVEIEDTTIHFVHQKSTHKNAIPILMLHGWGSTVSEFNKVIDPLVNPPEGEQAFHVVAPSLPGIGYSACPPKVGSTVVDNARLFNTLMTEVLGYKTYVGQGGDFGAINLRQVQFHHSDNMKLALYNSFFAPKPTDFDLAQLPDYEKHLLELVGTFTSVGMGYFVMQSTKVSTIGLTLYDNPQGFLSYLGEKYVMIQNWSNLTPEDHAKFMEELYVVICYSQFTNTIHTGMAMYQLNGNNAPSVFNTLRAAIGNPKEFVEDCREFYGKFYWEQPGVEAKSA